MICHSCGGEIKSERFIYRTDECSLCKADAHYCKNRTNFDPGALIHCRDPLAEWVADCERANFCDLFIPNQLKPSKAAGKNQNEGRKSFNDLFKK